MTWDVHGVLVSDASGVPLLGQLTMAGSLPVVFASDQSPLAITAAALPLPAGAATEATLAAGLDVALSTRASEVTLNAIGVLLAASLDTTLSSRASEATLATRASEATLATRASEATVATLLTTAAFQARINTLGQKTMANSTPVVIASDQSAIPVTGFSSTLTSEGATGAAVPADAIQIGGSDGTNLEAARVYDTDSGAGSEFTLGANLRRSASGGSQELLGTGTMAQSIPVTMASDQPPIDVNATLAITAIGATGAAVPADAILIGASDGTNLRAPRVFDVDTGGGTEYALGANLRISGAGGSIEAKGQQVMASSIPVALASDQSTITVGTTPDVTSAMTVTANGDIVSVALNGKTSVGALFVEIVNPKTIVFRGEQSHDGGTTWTDAYFWSDVVGAGYAMPSPIVGTSGLTPIAAITALSIMTSAGATHARIRVTTFGAGAGSWSMRITATDVRPLKALVGDSAGTADANVQMPVVAAGISSLGIVAKSHMNQPGNFAIVGMEAAGVAPDAENYPLRIGYLAGGNLQTPNAFDLDSGGGVDYVVGASLRRAGAGGSQALLGQTTMALSLPVTIASDQSAISMFGSVTATTTGASTSDISRNLATGGGTVPFTLTGGPYNYVGYQVTSNFAFIGTVVLEASYDLGTSWVSVAVGTADQLSTVISVAANNGAMGPAYRPTRLRLNATAYTSGSFDYVLSAYQIPENQTLMFGAVSSTLKVVPKIFDADTGAGTDYVLGSNLRISASGGSIEAKGSQLSASSIPVVIASDQNLATFANGAQTTVDATAGGVQILASNANRRSFIIQNVGSANMRVGLTGVTATTGMVRLVPGAIWERTDRVATAAIFAIRETATSTTALASETT